MLGSGTPSLPLHLRITDDEPLFVAPRRGDILWLAIGNALVEHTRIRGACYRRAFIRRADKAPPMPRKIRAVLILIDPVAAADFSCAAKGEDTVLPTGHIVRDIGCRDWFGISGIVEDETRCERRDQKIRVPRIPSLAIGLP
jgi:hypothetical protein